MMGLEKLFGLIRNLHDARSFLVRIVYVEKACKRIGVNVEGDIFKQIINHLRTKWHVLYYMIMNSIKILHLILPT